MKALRIFDHGDGTIRVKRDLSFNSLAPMAANELARFDIDADELPTALEDVDKRFWAWDGVTIVEASRSVQGAITGAEDSSARAEHDADAPSGTLAKWSKREKCLLLITYKLAKQHWPNMTKAQFLDNVKAEWDSIQE